MGKGAGAWLVLMHSGNTQQAISRTRASWRELRQRLNRMLLVVAWSTGLGTARDANGPESVARRLAAVDDATTDVRTCAAPPRRPHGARAGEKETLKAFSYIYLQQTGAAAHQILLLTEYE